ncbi:MAG: alpha-amylase [Bacteroidales bacterium]|nr:alpha-amylase [Bacteroidales bacterium]
MSKPVVYQMLPRIWGNPVSSPVPDGSLAENGCGKFGSIDEVTLTWLKEKLKVTHVWYTGVIRHATTARFPGCDASAQAIVKGKAGSPYAITDYYDVNPYLADNPKNRIDEFESLLNRTHSVGLKAIIDFIPNHVSRDYGKVGLIRRPASGVLGEKDDCSFHWRPENDFYYYPGQALILPDNGQYYENPAKASGNCFSPAPDKTCWYETIRLNYCDFHTPTWDRMLEIVRYWCLKGVDGFRCDMVEMVPWQFMKWLIAGIKTEFPDVIFIAEVYQKDLYRHYIGEVGFDMLYDKSGLYDTMRAIVEGKGPAKGITWNWQFLGDLQPRMLNFLENHDEQRFASGFFAKDPLKATAPLCAELMLNDAPYMIYSGQEIGEPGMDKEGFSGMDGRTTIFDWWSVASLRRLYAYIHDGEGLTAEESKVLELYGNILSLAVDQAFEGAGTYDLGYCQPPGNGFDPDKHFAFLRGRGGNAHLFVCDFSCEDVSMEIVIPTEALEYMGINKKETPKLSVSVRAFGYSVLPV